MGHPNRGRIWPIEDLARWIAEGQTHDEIAARLGCASQRISKLCQKYGIQCRRRGPRPGPEHPGWKGGRHVDPDGYILVWVADHPHARKRPGRRHPGGYVAEHRLVMERMLGRFLLPTEVVHHKNGVNDDNRPENLELFSSNEEHLRHELAGRCPNWTPEGKARILETVRELGANRRASGRGDRG